NSTPSIDTLEVSQQGGGITEDSIEVTVTVGDVYRFALTSAPSNAEVFSPSTEFAIETRDAQGNVSPVLVDTEVYAYTSSMAGVFSSSSSGPWDVISRTIFAGGASTSFFYKDDLTGLASLDFSDS